MTDPKQNAAPAAKGQNKPAPRKLSRAKIEALRARADEHASYVTAGNLTSLLHVWGAKYGLKIATDEETGMHSASMLGLTGKSPVDTRTAFANWGNKARRVLKDQGA